MIGQLSGGNQQKVIFARWLSTHPEILILDEPTRGIDIGSKNEIYRLISMLAEKGMAILLVSSELPELLALSDNIHVVREGKIVYSCERKDANAGKTEFLMHLELQIRKGVQKNEKSRKRRIHFKQCNSEK